MRRALYNELKDKETRKVPEFNNRKTYMSKSFVGLPDCNKNSKSRCTFRERELENWRLSQLDCTAIPIAIVFVIPAFAMPSLGGR